MKIKNFWVKDYECQSSLFKVYDVIKNELFKGELVYGVFELNISFARKLEMMLINTKNYIDPKYALTNCSWSEDIIETRTDHQLIKKYIQLGAKPLGQMSLCIKNNSARFVMGAYKEEMILTLDN